MCSDTFGGKNPRYVYSIFKVLLIITDVQKDLRINMSNDVKFGGHCSKIARAVHYRASLILRCLPNLEFCVGRCI